MYNLDIRTIPIKLKFVGCFLNVAYIHAQIKVMIEMKQ